MISAATLPHLMVVTCGFLVCQTLLPHATAFVLPQSEIQSLRHYSSRELLQKLLVSNMSDMKKESDSISFEKNLGPLASAAKESESSSSLEENSVAATNTVNERLLAELQEAADKEKYGAKSALGKKMGLDSFRSTKTDEERAAAIEEARNLNGVNPIAALSGSLVALAAAFGLWTLTNFLAEFFALHPVESDILFVSRATAVFRNVAIGLVSLAAGFFGVTGTGILLLGVRVAYGIFTGELDPTPLKKSRKAQEEVELPNVWDLMMNKKPTRRGSTRDGAGKDENNPFGI